MLVKFFTFIFSGEKFRERSKIQQGKESMYDYKQRYVYVNIIIVFGLIMTIVLTPTVLSEGGTMLLAAFQCFLAFLMLASFLLRRIWGGGSERFYSFYGKLLPVLALSFLFGLMYYRGGNSGFVGIWVVLTPLIAVFTLGTKNGTIVSALMCIWIFAADFIPGRPEHYFNYGIAVTFRLFGVALGIWLLSFAYEHSRIKSQNHIYGIIDELMMKNDEIESQNKMIMDSINYASKIQKNLLPNDSAFEAAFSDYSIIWKPRDIVGGDVYWLREFEKGTVLCACDCTGHGTPGALLTMLVNTALDSLVTESNCENTADIIWQLDRRISQALRVEDSDARRSITDISDGCDIAVLFVTRGGTVKFSSGNIPVFVCNGKEVTVHKGQKLFVGEGRLKSSDEMNIICVPADPDNKFYIASDGLFDQIGGERGIQFGYDTFKQTILEHHARKLPDITGKVWDEYERYRGAQVRRDDFELVAFKP